MPPRRKLTPVKSEHHAALARLSIEGRGHDAAGHWLPRTPVSGEEPLTAPELAQPAIKPAPELKRARKPARRAQKPAPPPPVVPPDPPPARPRRRDPVTFRVRA